MFGQDTLTSVNFSVKQGSLYCFGGVSRVVRGYACCRSHHHSYGHGLHSSKVPRIVLCLQIRKWPLVVKDAREAQITGREKIIKMFLPCKVEDFPRHLVHLNVNLQK